MLLHIESLNKYTVRVACCVRNEYTRLLCKLGTTTRTSEGSLFSSGFPEIGENYLARTYFRLVSFLSIKQLPSKDTPAKSPLDLQYVKTAAELLRATFPSKFLQKRRFCVLESGGPGPKMTTCAACTAGHFAQRDLVLSFLHVPFCFPSCSPGLVVLSVG